MKGREVSATQFSFSSFGVGVTLDFFDSELLDRFRASLHLIFKDTLTEKNADSEDRIISLRLGSRDDEFVYTFENEQNVFIGTEERLFRLLRTLVRVTVAGYSREKLFIHAGAVSWNGKGMILPAHSHAGKTSLVVELCRLGAEYYSDEYAVVDRDGFIHPFPKHLSIRGEGGRFDQTDTGIDEIGGVAASAPVRCELVLFCEYTSGTKTWNPSAITQGEALLKLIPHMIALPKDPKFALELGGALVNKNGLFVGERGDVGEFAPKILELLDKS
jgi:hypothetical protein